jgi:hypothetical protein
MSFAAEISIDKVQRGIEFIEAHDYEARIKLYLPPRLKNISFKVDVATQDPRPLNPIAEPGKIINIFNPANAETSPAPLADIYRFIPARVRHFRVFALNHDYDEELSAAAAKALDNIERAIPTNV